MLEQIQQTAQYIQSKMQSFQPTVGIILGSGLGGLVKEIEVKYTIPYSEIPHFPQSTVQGHKGQLIIGYLAEKPVLAMQGRFHYYEGYDMKQITFPVRVMKQLGIEKLIVSNAAGGMNPEFQLGELMIIKDHINFFPSNPLIGKNYDELGPRFLDMSEAYCKEYRDLAKQIAEKHTIRVKEGVYMGVSGPCFETPAEYRCFWRMGADAVGMSTVPEVIVARHGGMKVFGMSIITDLGIEGHIENVSHEEVLKVATAQEPKMSLIVKELVRIIG